MKTPKLVQMPNSGDTPEQVLTRALEAAKDGAFDEIMIVAQYSRGRKDDGMVWFGRNDATLAMSMYLLQAGLFCFNCMAAGIKL